MNLNVAFKRKKNLITESVRLLKSLTPLRMKRKAPDELEKNLKTNNSGSDQKQVVTFDDVMVMINNNQGVQVINLFEDRSFQNINLINDDSILMRATMVGDEILVRYLLAHGADLSYESHHSGHTALSLACLYGHESLVRLFFEYKADPNSPSGQLPLVMACRNGDIKIVELLLNDGADIDKWSWFVFDERHENYLEYDYYDDASSGTQYYRAPNALMTACLCGHIDLVRLLLQRGVKVDEVLDDSKDNNLGMTPLTFGSKGGHWDIVKLLHEHGALLHGARDYDASTPLMHACAQGNLEVVKMLLDLGADINESLHGLSCGKYRDSPLLSACLYGHLEIVQFILEHEKFDSLDKVFKYAIIEAYEYGSPEIIEELESYLDENQSITSKKFINNIFFEACGAGRAKAAKTLLEMSATVDIHTKSGRTGLMEACHSGLSTADLIPLLVEYGADVTVKNKKGQDIFSLIRCTWREESSRRKPLQELCEQYKESNRRDREPDEMLLK